MPSEKIRHHTSWVHDPGHFERRLVQVDGYATADLGQAILEVVKLLL